MSWMPGNGTTARDTAGPGGPGPGIALVGLRGLEPLTSSFSVLARVLAPPSTAG